MMALGSRSCSQNRSQSGSLQPTPTGLLLPSAQEPEQGEALEDVTCLACQKPMKLVRTDLLTGQEKYEAEK